LYSELYLEDTEATTKIIVNIMTTHVEWQILQFCEYTFV
jgi:hypothetical protein